MSTEPSMYMRQSATPPGSLNHMFKPLSSEIGADIATLKGTLDALKAHNLFVPSEAFNRLMAELHVTSESSRVELDSKVGYTRDLNAIDAALDAAGIPSGATVDRVNAIIRRATDVEAAAPQALDAVRACAQVLSGDGMSKSLLIRALEKCKTVMHRANGERPERVS